MNQALKQNPPTIEQQIDFIRGARHLVSEQRGGEISLTTANYPMLVAIEENLIAVKLWNETLTKTLDEGSKEVGNG